MAVYMDDRGWLYRCMEDFAGKWCPRYQKPGKGGWKCCHGFDHVAVREESEAALSAWAKKKGMKKI
jgi:hypothetical protein